MDPSSKGNSTDVSPDSALKATIDHFIHNLPDSSMELYIQPLHEPSFGIFPELPIEIRFKIWSLALPNGRKVKLIYRRRADSKGFTYSLPPLTLQICHESRMETLKNYQVLLKYNKTGTSPPIYFDPNVDKIVVDCYALCCSVLPEARGFEKFNLEFIQCLQVEGARLVPDQNPLSGSKVALALEYDAEFGPPGKTLPPDWYKGLRKVVFVLDPKNIQTSRLLENCRRERYKMGEKPLKGKGETNENSEPQVLVVEQKFERLLVMGDW